MTPADFTAALATIGWSQSHLARLLACDTNLTSRWATGRAAIPPSIARWLTKLAGAHHRAPVPTDWRIRQAIDAA